MLKIPFSHHNSHTHTLTTFVTIVALTIVIIFIYGLLLIVVNHICTITRICSIVHLLMIQDELYAVRDEVIVATNNQYFGMCLLHLIIYKVYTMLSKLVGCECGIISIGILSSLDSFSRRSYFSIFDFDACDGSRKRL